VGAANCAPAVRLPRLASGENRERQFFVKLRWKWAGARGTLASRATSFAMQADGRLLLAGLVENPGGNQDFAVIRLVKQPGW
jgi:hypothetical protein